MTRALFLAVALVLGGGIALHVGQEEGAAWFRDRPGEEKEHSPVLVFLVRAQEDVDAVEEAVGGWSIVARDADSLALVEGRIVAINHAAAGKALTAAGWSDRPLEIFGPAVSRERERPERGEGSDRPTQSGGVDLEALQRKATLTAGEAIAVLRGIESGAITF